MVEKANRTNQPVPRSTAEPQWEVFVREEEDGTLEYVGAVAAPSADVAHEEASKLFAWYARDVWICPAAEVQRYSTFSLGEEYETDGETDSSSESDEGGEVDRSLPGAHAEQRVYEETEGTPEVQTEGEPEVQTEGEPEVQTEGEPEVQTEGEPEVQTEGTPEVQTEGSPDVRGEDR